MDGVCDFSSVQMAQATEYQALLVSAVYNARTFLLDLPTVSRSSILNQNLSNSQDRCRSNHLDMGSSGLPRNGDENRQGGILGTTFTVTVLATVVVALRMATRIWLVRNVGWDDYTILFATIGIIIGCGLVVVQVHYGLGRHKFYLTKWQFIEFTKYSYGEWIQTFQTLMFNKLSICFLLLRIPVEKHFIRPI